MKPTILAMDLEGTLISNAVSQIPRPGLDVPPSKVSGCSLMARLSGTPRWSSPTVSQRRCMGGRGAFVCT